MSVPAISWSGCVRLPAHPGSLAITRGFIQDLLVENDLPYLVEDVRLVASELASNATRHAETPFTVRLEGLSDSVRLTVTDESSSRPIRSEMQLTATAGRGLNIVRSYSRDWGVTRGNGTKSVWASFALQSREPVDAHVERLRGSLAPGQATPSLSSLLRNVKEARASLRAARTGGRTDAVRQVQEELVNCLTLYVEALAKRNLPVPYLLRDELRLYGRTSAYMSRWGGSA
jgi:anti-sigma regulatory factor (Ser/Thr protein kinase)